MTQFTFLHAADIHLDSPLAGLSRYEGVPVELVRRAPRAAFDALIAAAIATPVDFVLIAGDLFDGEWRDMGTGLYFAAAMGQLGRAGIPVYLLAGNHDAASVLTRELPALEGLHRFSTREPQTHLIDRLGVAIHGRSFAERSVSENIAATYPARSPGYFNIGMLHTSLGGDAAHETYAPCSLQDLLAKGYDYWALGHVHEHRIVHARPPVIFPGNLQGRSIREPGARGAILVEVADGEVLSLRRLELDTVRWTAATLELEGIGETGELHRAIRQALRDAMRRDADGRALVVRLTLTGSTPLHGELQGMGGRLRDDICSLAAEISSEIWIEKLLLRTAPPPETAMKAAGDAALAVPPPDTALAEILQADLKRFLSALPAPESDSLAGRAQRGDVAELMEAAAAALRFRLGQHPDRPV